MALESWQGEGLVLADCRDPGALIERRLTLHCCSSFMFR
jgi:hypothetical protein